MPSKKQPETAGGVSADAVKAKTGKDWREWFAILDKAGAKKMTHKEIVAYLVEHHDVPPWWQQMVTVAYEQERGLRDKHQQPGGYAVSASRTVPVPVAALYKAWRGEKSRARWLSKPALTIRKATPHKSLRVTWVDGRTHVDVYFYEKGESKSQVTVQHSKLADAKQAARMKAFWSEALAALKKVLADEA